MKNKKNPHLIFVFLIFLILPTLLNAQTSSLTQDIKSPEIQKILNRGKLIVALPALTTPLFFERNANNELYGLEIENARAIGKALGVPVVFNTSATTFDAIPKLIAEGKADIAICDLTITLPRAMKIFFTQPYVVTNHALLINRLWLAQQEARYLSSKQQEINAVDLLKSEPQTISLLQGSSYVYMATNAFPKATLQTFPTIDALFEAVKQNKVNVMFDDDFNIKLFLLENPSVGLKYKSIVLTNLPNPIAMGVAPGNQHLLHWLNLYIDASQLHYDTDKLIEYYMSHKNDKK
ncbi:MAG: hypothetical protein A3C55_04725 [Gammaproteobacteria bacterium RIFCSPHIGHO2_02_FULL_42_13]|nr:MAG: hypothetical protein A3C55_04725 [Gammaproteobacteria bacterium RIFCSPHIGHO2_02_FULL_42_13]